MADGPRAVLFDCDGILADSEPLHLRAFQDVLRPLGIALTREDYVADYLGFDDRGVFTEAMRVAGRRASDADIHALMQEKAVAFRRVLERDVLVYPGVASFVAACAGLPLGVVSGALRDEVEIILRHAGIRDAFRVIVAAEDVAEGKPDPEGYLRALAALQAPGVSIAPAECLVVEDSLAGLEAGRRAGMRRLAVTNSYPADQLRAAADHVVATLEGLTLAHLRPMFSRAARPAG
ncbi:MAG TPA: HAD family phosphatase [Candidatus Binatia bacterium]